MLYSHPRCYASDLGDCSSKISGEHAISDNMLRVFEESGGLIDLGGTSWMGPSERAKLPIATLGSKVLCSNHNHALGHLDVAGGRVVKHWAEVATHLRVHRRRRPMETRVFDGPEFERWMLKVLCGLTVSGIAASPAGTDRTWRPPRSWLDVLFGVSSMPEGFGLYLRSQAGDRLPNPSNFSFAIVGNPGRGVLGMVAEFMHKRFSLAMIVPDDRPGSLTPGLQRHPMTFTETSQINTAKTVLSWPEGTGCEVVIVWPNPRTPVDQSLTN